MTNSTSNFITDRSSLSCNSLFNKVALPWKKQIDYWNTIQKNNIPHGWIFVGQNSSNIDIFSLLLAQFFLNDNHLLNQDCLINTNDLHKNAIGSYYDIDNKVHNDSITAGKRDYLSEFIQKNFHLIKEYSYNQNFLFLSSEFIKTDKNHKLSSREEINTNKKHLISIELIRNARYFLQQTTSMGKYKILLIDSINHITIDGMNALLKILEEPSNDTLIILLCNNIRQIPKTIKSRCSIMKFDNISYEEFIYLMQMDRVTDKNLDQRLHSMCQDDCFTEFYRYLYRMSQGYIKLAKEIILSEIILTKIKNCFLLQNDVLFLQKKILLNNNHSDLFIEKNIKLINNHVLSCINEITACKIASYYKSTILNNMIATLLFSLQDLWQQSEKIDAINYDQFNHSFYLKIEKTIKLINETSFYHLDDASCMNRMINIWQ